MGRRATHIDMRPLTNGAWDMRYSNLDLNRPLPSNDELSELTWELLDVDDPQMSPLERSMCVFEANGGELHPVQYQLLGGFKDTIVYEDSRMLVASKPPYVTTNWDNGGHVAFGDFAQNYTRTNIAPVHQIDRLTSGLVVMGKDAVARAILSRQFEDKTSSNLKKVYLAQVEGDFEDDRGILTSIKSQLRFQLVEKGSLRVRW